MQLATHGIIHTSVERLQLALQGLKDQAKAAELMMPGSPPGDIMRGRTRLQDAQGVMAAHHHEVSAIIKAVYELDTTVPDISVQEVIGGGFVVIDGGAQ